MTFTTVLLLASLGAQNPPPAFQDRERRAKLDRSLPAVDRAFAKYFEQTGVPGLAYGVIVDGQLIHAKALGVARRQGSVAATPETRFRIASMTKSFTALAILKLRDQGKLTLEDPIARWIPEVRAWKPVTADADTIRIRHLLTHGAGFPEDNPWGDQQLGISDAALNAWLKQGVPFSTSPGTAYEYSNYGFALLGRIVTNASGRPYRAYLEREILAPLGMTASTLEPGEAPAAQTAIGYRRTAGEYSVEPSLAHGAFGAMGGLVTTVRDLAKYVAFQLDAWPPRDGAEAGPVRRASRREMQSLWRYSGTRVQALPAQTQISTGGYGYGLGVSHHCAYGTVVSHGGGLPGFGSQMFWLPESGLGIIAMTNLTYSGPTSAVMESLEAMRQQGALSRRAWPPAPVLTEMQREITAIWNTGDGARLEKAAAMNLLLDHPLAERMTAIERMKRRMGACTVAGPVEPENWLRGRFRMNCERGHVWAEFTLAPVNPPKLQYLAFDAVRDPLPEVRRAAEVLSDFRLPPVVEGFDTAGFTALAARTQANYGACQLGEVVGGDGEERSVIRLHCERGALDLDVRREAGLVRSAVYRRAPGGGCLP